MGKVWKVGDASTLLSIECDEESQLVAIPPVEPRDIVSGNNNPKFFWR